MPAARMPSTALGNRSATASRSPSRTGLDRRNASTSGHGWSSGRTSTRSDVVSRPACTTTSVRSSSASRPMWAVRALGTSAARSTSVRATCSVVRAVPAASARPASRRLLMASRRARSARRARPSVWPHISPTVERPAAVRSSGSRPGAHATSREATVVPAWSVIRRRTTVPGSPSPPPVRGSAPGPWPVGCSRRRADSAPSTAGTSAVTTRDKSSTEPAAVSDRPRPAMPSTMATWRSTSRWWRTARRASSPETSARATVPARIHQGAAVVTGWRSSTVTRQPRPPAVRSAMVPPSGAGSDCASTRSARPAAVGRSSMRTPSGSVTSVPTASSSTSPKIPVVA